MGRASRRKKRLRERKTNNSTGCLKLAHRIAVREKEEGWDTEVCLKHDDGIHVHITCEHGDLAGDWIILAPDHVELNSPTRPISLFGPMVDLMWPPYSQDK